MKMPFKRFSNSSKNTPEDDNGIELRAYATPQAHGIEVSVEAFGNVNAQPFLPVPHRFLNKSKAHRILLAGFLSPCRHRYTTLVQNCIPCIDDAQVLNCLAFISGFAANLIGVQVFMRIYPKMEW